MSEKNPQTPDNQELVARIEAQDAIIQELLEQANELKAQVERQPGNSLSVGAPKPQTVPELPEQSFKVNKVEYKFKLRSFRFRGQKYFAADALKDAELLALLVVEAPGLFDRV